MEVQGVATQIQATEFFSQQSYKAKDNEKSLVLGSLEEGLGSKVSFQDLYKSLNITSKKIVDSLNEKLKEKLPDGIQSLKPQDVTPEATADRVVSGIVSLFSSFEKQNPNLNAEEVIAKFIEEAKRGVEQGYSEAVGTLKDLGALEIDGVESGISKTKSLILEKLDKFAEFKMNELVDVANQSANITRDNLIVSVQNTELLQ